jgi:hypothetical protein
LRHVDPQLTTLENVNSYEDYLAALTAVGFAAPEETGESDGQTL